MRRERNGEEGEVEARVDSKIGRTPSSNFRTRVGTSH
jgi:hypothetical protein